MLAYGLVLMRGLRIALDAQEMFGPSGRSESDLDAVYTYLRQHGHGDRAIAGRRRPFTATELWGYLAGDYPGRFRYPHVHPDTS